MATYDELMAALRKADAAGDVEAAKAIARRAAAAKGAPALPAQPAMSLPADSAGAPVVPQEPPAPVPFMDQLAGLMEPTQRMTLGGTPGMFGGVGESQMNWARQEAARKAATEIVPAPATSPAMIPPAASIGPGPVFEQTGRANPGSLSDQAAVARIIGEAMAPKPSFTPTAPQYTPFGEALKAELGNVPERVGIGFLGNQLAWDESGIKAALENIGQAKAVPGRLDEVRAAKADVQARFAAAEAAGSDERFALAQEFAALDAEERRLSDLMASGDVPARVSDAVTRGRETMTGYQRGRRDTQDRIDALEAQITPVNPAPGLSAAAVSGIASVADMAPGLVTTLITKNPLPMLAYLGAYSRGSTYVDKRAAGYDSGKAATAANLYALAEAVPEVLPLHVILRAGGGALSKVFGGAVTEGASEVLTQGLQQLVDMGVLDERMTWGQAVEEMKQSGMAGAVMGGLMGGGAVLADNVRERIADRQAKAGTPADPNAAPPAATVEPGSTPPAAPLTPEAQIASAMVPQQPEAAPAAPAADVAPVPPAQTPLAQIAATMAPPQAPAPAVPARPAAQPITRAEAEANPDRYEILPEIEGQGANAKPTGRDVVLDSQTGQVYPLAPEAAPAPAAGGQPDARPVEPQPGGGAAPAGTLPAGDAAGSGRPAQPVVEGGNTGGVQPAGAGDAQAGAGAPAAGQQRPALTGSVVRSDVAKTPTGTDVQVDYAVVDLDSLLASNLPDGRLNPAYPQERQPRDRTKDGSEQQIQRIMRDFDPRQLDAAPTTDTGAPIVDETGIVESGNGRTMMLQRIYQDRPDLASAYQDYLRRMGYPVDGLRKPVLVRIRRTPMTPAEIVGYTRDSNTDTKLSMTAAEQALADGKAIPAEVIALYRGGDIDAAQNRDFVRGFLRTVVPENEQATMIARDGAMSQEAVRRIQGALIARAYDDAPLVEKLTEAADTNIKAIGGALLDVAAAWAKMRAAAASGQIAAEMDQTAALLESVNLVNRARSEGRNVIEYVKQPDLLSGDGISPMGQRFLALMFRDTRQWTKPAGRDRMAQGLSFYVEEAMKTAPGADMFGGTANPDSTLDLARRKQDEGQPDPGAQGDLLRPKAPAGDGGGVRPAGGDGTRPGEPAPVGQDGGQRQEGRGGAAVTPPSALPEITTSSAATFANWKKSVPSPGTVLGWRIFDDRLVGGRWVLMTPEKIAQPFSAEADARAWAMANPAVGAGQQVQPSPQQKEQTSGQSTEEGERGRQEVLTPAPAAKPAGVPDKGKALIIEGRNILSRYAAAGDASYDAAASEDISDSPEALALANTLANAQTATEKKEAVTNWVLTHGRATGVEILVALDHDGVPLTIRKGHKSGVGPTAALWRAGAAGDVGLTVHNHPSNSGPSGSDLAILSMFIGHRMVIVGHDGKTHEMVAAKAFQADPEKARRSPGGGAFFTELATILRETRDGMIDVLNRQAWEVARRSNWTDSGEAAFSKAHPALVQLVMAKMGLIRYIDEAKWRAVFDAQGFDLEAIHGQVSGPLSDRLRRAGFDIPETGDRGGDRAAGSGAEAAPSRTGGADQKPARDGEGSDAGRPQPVPAGPVKTGNDALDGALDDLFGNDGGEDVPSPGNDLERGGGGRPAQDRLGGTDVPAAAGQSGQGAGSGAGTDRGGNRKRPSAGGVPGGDAAAVGGRGDRPADGPDGADSKPAAGGKRGGRSGGGRRRLSPDAGRGENAAGNAPGAAGKLTPAERLAAIRNILKEDLIDFVAGPERRGTDSEAFRKWFGDSKVVDADGDPLILWHGTARRLWEQDFDAFRGTVWASEGSFLPMDYAAMRANRIGADQAQERLIDLYMRVERPFDADLGLPKAVTVGDMITAMIEQAEAQGRRMTEGDLAELRHLTDIIQKARRREESGPHYGRHDFWYQPEDYFGRDGAQAIRDAFRITGFDGIKMLEGGEQTWGAFDPAQVKSPQNIGAFDPTDPVIFREDQANPIDPRKAEALDAIFVGALDGVDTKQATDRQLFASIILPLKDAGMTRDEVAQLAPYLEDFLSRLRAGRVGAAPETAAAAPDTDALVAKADRTRVVFGDKDNIDATLPLLLPEQRDDVLKAETRFAKPDGHGFMLTNSTGTGKTYSAGGVIKRFHQAGKKNILIIAPDATLPGWGRTLEALGVPSSRLTDTKDAGEGVVFTTHQNAGANDALASRDWDLVVVDEAQYLSQNKDGGPTSTLNTVRAITGRPQDLWRRSMMLHSDDWAAHKAMKDGEAKTAFYRRLKEREDREVQAWAAKPRAKALFLSATPFAYDKSIDFAEGYLFDYPKDGHVGNSRQDGRAIFMVQNFGYRIRYHKLTRPEHAVDSAVFEREFHEKLRRDGVLSGRSLHVDVDYDRRFVTVADAIGTEIDAIIKTMREGRSSPDKALADGYKTLNDLMKTDFGYLERMQLLEAIKAKAAVADIRKHLALGRKVVVFHDFNKGGGFNPFAGLRDMRILNDANALKALGDLSEKHPGWDKLDFSGYPAPATGLKAEFGKRAGVFSGLTKKDRDKQLAAFNTDGSGVDVLIVQADAGGAGVSMHDVTGNHQRVLINLGMPTKPTTTLQQEGRILRVGTRTDAAFRYYTIGTGWEREAFAKRIAERSGTVENLALGNQARAITEAFVDAYMDAEAFDPSEADGKGGKAKDRSGTVTTPWQKAIAHYFGRMKTSGRRDQREGIDFYPTPEPLALKMVEWAGIRPNERVLEPSAGDGAIARYMPDYAAITLVEPSHDLGSTALLRAPKANLVQGRFETFHIVNKAHVIVMNPPFGAGGATAMEHLAKAARHLRPGGRIVALIPTGPSADKRFAKWWESDEAEGLNLSAEVQLPAIAFERAGTSVMTRVVVIDKPADGQVIPQGQQNLNFTGATSIKDFFDRLESYEVRRRPEMVGDVLDQMEAEGQDATAPIPVQRPAPPVGGGVQFTLKETKHPKSGESLFVARHEGIAADDVFSAMRAVAKAHGGYWYGRGTAPGFTFNSEAARQAFLDDMAKPTVNGLEETAYHGTPHDFDQFSLDHIGRGEGAQVYGWGLYFAGQREVAEYYRRTLSRARLTINGKEVPADLLRNEIGAGVIDRINAMLFENKPEKPVEVSDDDWRAGRVLIPYELRATVSALNDKVLSDGGDDPMRRLAIYRITATAQYKGAAERQNPDRHEYAAKLAAIDWLSSRVGTSNRPRLYTVDIPNAEVMLDWDKSLPEQPEGVRKALEPVAEAMRKHYRPREKALVGGLDRLMATVSGREIIDFLQEHGPLYGLRPDGIEFAKRVDPKVSHVIQQVKDAATGEVLGEGSMISEAMKAAGLKPDQSASLILRKLGIPGHRYLNGASRSRGEGGHNYVIYDDAAIKVLQKEQRARLTREARASAEAIRAVLPQLRAELDRLDLKRVRLSMREGNPGWQGAFVVTGEGEMEIVIGASLDPMRTLHHEVIHALRAMNLFTPEEWRALSLAASRSWLEKHDISARYPHLAAEERIEEAIAEEFSEAFATRTSPRGSILVRAFNKIARIFRAFRTVLTGKGYDTPEAIFGAVLSGEISKRAAANTGVAMLGQPGMAQFQSKAPRDNATGDLFAPPEPAKPSSMTADQRREIEARQKQSKMRRLGGNSGDAGPLFNDDRDLFGERTLFQAKPLAVRPLTAQGRAHRNSAMGPMPFVPDRRIWETLTAAGVPIWQRLRDLPGAASDAVDRARYVIQDRFLPVLRAQEAVERQIGRRLPKEHDAYTAETTFSGKVGRHLLDIDERFTKPIIRIIAASKGRMTADSVGEWLYARHVIERNAYIASINLNMPDGGSGMLDADAQAVLQAVAASPDAAAYDQIGNLVDQMREWGIKQREDAGLLSNHEANLWRTQFKHYVPLKGFEETDHAESIMDLRGVRTGRRFSIRGPETRRALGRQSEAFNPLQSAITMAQEVAIRSEKNRVAQALYDLAKNYPSAALWSIKKPAQKRYFNRTTGLVETRVENPVTMVLEPNEMAVKIGGAEHRILFHDERLAEAAGTLGADQMSGVLRVLSVLSRFFSMTRTMLNPEFMVTNAFRDFQTAQFNIQAFGEGDKARIATAMAKNWRKAFLGVMRGQTYRFDTEWSRYFNEFQKAGAQVWFWTMEQPEAGREHLEKRIHLARGSRARRLFYGLVAPSFRDNPALAFIERVNMAVDNAIRLAAFVEARKAGWPVEKAAFLAKELTVNFNRRGEAGAAMNALYPFFNAAVQGTVRTVKALSSRRVAMMALAAFSGGLILDLVNAALSEEDDDGEKLYDKVPNYRNERNLHFVLWGTGDNPLAVPMPYGYNVFPYAGQQLGKVLRGVKAPDEAFGDVMAAAFGAFSPISAATPAQMVSPFIADPIVEMAENKNWVGTPIYPETYGHQTEPDAYVHFRGATEVSKWVAQTLNSLTGGDFREPGYVDVSPETLDHLATFVSGSAGAFWGRNVDIVAKIAQGDLEGIEGRNVPFMRNLSSPIGDWADRDRYYRFGAEVRNAQADRKAYEAAGVPVPKRTAALAGLYESLLAAERERSGKGEWNPSKPGALAAREESAVFLDFNRKYISVMGRQGE